MELEKIIKQLWDPLAKKYSKEYVLSQIISRDKKDIILNILTETGKRNKEHRPSAKIEFLNNSRHELS